MGGHPGLKIHRGIIICLCKRGDLIRCTCDPSQDAEATGPPYACAETMISKDILSHNYYGLRLIGYSAHNRTPKTKLT